MIAKLEVHCLAKESLQLISDQWFSKLGTKVGCVFSDWANVIR